MFEPTTLRNDMKGCDSVERSGRLRMNGHGRLRARFAGRVALLELLLSSDPEFAMICEDFCLAVEAGAFWREKGDIGLFRASEYARIADELEAEISTMLDERQSEFPAGGGT